MLVLTQHSTSNQYRRGRYLSGSVLNAKDKVVIDMSDAYPCDFFLVIKRRFVILTYMI